MSNSNPVPSPEKRKLVAYAGKVRRLNYKLSQIEKLVDKMDTLSNNGDPLDPKIVKMFVKAFRKEIGRANATDITGANQSTVE